MRFLFVGDSMTIGRAGEHSWRYRMWQHLEASFDGSYEIVGPRSGPYAPEADAAPATDDGDPAFPPEAHRHLAGWGEGWLHMAPIIGETVAEHRPDVLLVSLGLIDLGFYTNSGQTVVNTHRFIAEARAAAPTIRMVLLPVIPNVRARTDAPFAAECDRFNELLAKTVADLDTAVSPLLLASRPSSYALDTDTYDGTHPSPTGEHKLASAFASAMHQGWGLGGRYEPASDEGVRVPGTGG
ncbi:GDSL-type esterase/lipase family protein [Streptomyces albipurpureus]|uniref:GDSL-type esterase/lipase family protein n=1 Tax=Streptomyces albipurpureus TaxID=2897419 RepID=A0ABT0UTD7_9ACTN|nr:GDSL-type esterase/lipase family protein [Streptomyces sp. CWNU-1]MCM2391857.1 GDSL-type esterase/lipase family protein [Streptomyces sp. CWNU-1]